MTNNTFIKYWSRKIYRRAVQTVGSRLYIDKIPDVNKSILIAGTARSGTTWLTDMIASQVNCRIMFEPFQSELVNEYKKFNYFQYMHPSHQNDQLYTFAQKVMSGKIRDRWIDRENERIFPKYRLIKEIRANLFLKWLHDHFPEVPVLFILRHPCAVVLSRLQLGWATDTDITPFLQQPALVSDFLLDKLDMINRAEFEEEKHTIIWCISNMVPLAQLTDDDMKLIYYEDLITQPDEELSNIFNYINQPYKHSVLDQTNVPSLTTKRTSPVFTGENKISNWKKSLSTQQIDRIINVVNAFGLSHLYGNSELPLNNGSENRPSTRMLL